MVLNFSESTAYRKKWMPELFQAALQNGTVGTKIMAVDEGSQKYIENPYASNASITQQAIAGTYSVNTFTVTADTLTVADEFVWSEQVYDYEQLSSVADVKGSRMKEAMAKMATAIDKYALNALAAGGTGTYTTPTGGFTRDNVPTILSDLSGKFAGYAEDYNGKYLVIENTDLPGLINAGMTNGFNFADTFLRGGYVGTLAFGGFDVYVVRSGTFVTATLGTLSATNANKRVAGIKNMATFALPAGKGNWMEKEVSGKTGWELAMAAYAGVRVWAQKAALTVVITLA